jgi:hypothetical protein
VQTNNCLSNQTTFERFGNQRTKANSSSKSVSVKTESLREELIPKNNSILNSSVGEKELESRSVQLFAEVRASPGHNCYQMCFANADNLAYQVGACS